MAEKLTIVEAVLRFYEILTLLRNLNTSLRIACNSLHVLDQVCVIDVFKVVDVFKKSIHFLSDIYFFSNTVAVHKTSPADLRKKL